MRKIFASNEMTKLAKKADNNSVQVYSFFPIDRANCACQKMIIEHKKKLAGYNQEKRDTFIKEAKYLTCTRDKTGMRKRIITCKNCKDIQGYVWSTDNTLEDWCDFHYVQWTQTHRVKSKSKKPVYETLWHGCLTPNVSPITEQFTLECCCGQDTRDFRANMTMNAKSAYKIEEKNKIGREFGKPNSKFTTRVVRVNMLPFNNG